MEIPVEAYEECDAYARVYTEKDVLMFHLWDAETFKGKYFIDKTGKHVSELKGERCIRKLVSQMSSTGRYSSGLWPLDLTVSLEDEEMVESFFGRRGSVASLIEHAEAYYDKTRYYRKQERKAEKIHNYMSLFKDQQDEIKNWYLKEIAPQEYAFRIDGQYHCTACGKQHTGKFKHSERFQCEGKTVIVSTRTWSKEQKDYITAFSRQSDGSLAERLYQINVRWDKTGKMVDLTEILRWTWMPYKEGKVYYRDLYNWWDRNQWNRRWMPSYLYPVGAEEVLQTSGYEETRLWDIGKAKLPINWIMEKRTPVYTQLVLAGLQKLAEQNSKAKLAYYGYNENLNLHGETPEEVLGLDRNAIGRLKQLNGGSIIHEWLQWRMEHPNEPLKTETLKELETAHITPNSVKEMLDYMTPQKCLNFIKRQMKLLNKNVPYSVIELYTDYISMAKGMGMDAQDEIVYNPKDLKLRHDQLVQEFELRKAEYEAEAMNRKWPKAQAVLDRIKGIYDYQGDGWQIITPCTLMDIVDDSHQLHHCAGASDRYYERIQTEETYILFLRHEREKSWYTLEVEPGGTVRQKRSEYNRQPDLEVVNQYLKEWQVAVHKRLKERDKQLAAQSAQQRAEEMEVLRNGTERNRQLRALLMADLMEAGA